MREADVRDWLLALPEAVEDYPFGPDAAVFKVAGRMFALLYHQAGALRLNLKCEPEQAQMLRDVFSEVRPGYHMNKRHWNTLALDGQLPAGEIRRQIEHSYARVVACLPRAVRNGLQARHGDALPRG